MCETQQELGLQGLQVERWQWTRPAGSWHVTWGILLDSAPLHPSANCIPRESLGNHSQGVGCLNPSLRAATSQLHSNDPRARVSHRRQLWPGWEETPEGVWAEGCHSRSQRPGSARVAPDEKVLASASNFTLMLLSTGASPSTELHAGHVLYLAELGGACLDLNPAPKL